MGLSVEVMDYLGIFIRTNPFPGFDPEIWSDFSMAGRCGRGMALRTGGVPLTERELSDVVMYVHAFGKGGLNNPGSIRTAFERGFEEYSKKLRKYARVE